MHRLRVALIGIALSVAPLAGCQQQQQQQAPPPAEQAAERPAVGPAPDTVAGRIGSEDVTVGEIDAWVKDQLFRQATRGNNPVKIFELRSRALEQMATEQAADRVAAERGTDREALVREEIDRRTSVTDEEVQAYYDENKSRFRNMPFDKVASSVKRQLLAQRQVQAMQDYTRELREQFGYENRLESPRFEIAATGPSRGPADAPVTLVEFSDYECPFCKAAEPVVAGVLERYPTQVKLVFKHYPLSSHAKARPAAEAAMCAAEQDKFWEFHAKLFEKAPNIAAEQLKSIAAEVEGLDPQTFEACVASGRVKDAVQADLDAGSEAGVAGTPSFFVNGAPLTGGRSVEDFAKAIDAELERLGLPVPPAPVEPVAQSGAATRAAAPPAAATPDAPPAAQPPAPGGGESKQP